MQRVIGRIGWRVGRSIAGVLAAAGTAGAAPSTAATADADQAKVRAARAHAGASGRHWIYFTDKALATAADRERALAAAREALDPHAAARRALRRTRPGLVDESDVPVADGYVRALEAIGARAHVRSRWLNAVSVRATPSQLAAISRLPFVDRVEPVLGGRGLGERPQGALSPTGADDFYGLSSQQLGQINLLALHAQGFTGAGVRVGILDTGFKRTHAAFNHPGHPLQVVAEHDFVRNDGNTGPEAGDHPDQHVHGTLILGVLGAYKPTELVGGAYDAAFILCKTEDIESETPIEEDNYVGGLEFIEQHGGDVATASLVYIDWYTYSQLNGTTAVTSIAVNIATSNGLHCLNAAGNSGHDADPMVGHLGGAPADALKVLTVGAAEGDGSTAGFSSDGPTADGRLKPEIMARGAGTSTVDPGNDAGYAGASGTSLSTPVAACAVACLAQARPWWSVDQMRSRLFAKASEQVANGFPDPLGVRGYGIINAAASLDCYANCDGSSAAPVLNVNDFTCFLNRFASAGSLGVAAQVGDYSNCDRSTTPPVLNVNDFVCFLNKFGEGCP
ncbi:MAG: S8 family serine peptidase [Phycisphaerae bacterium]|nr:S8 family serine peptidase [Phycisphaerae bacterium]